MTGRISLLLIAMCWLLLPVASDAQEPPATSVLRIGFAPNESPGLDPHRSTDALSFRLISTVYETLYMWTPGEHPQVVPCLAADFPEVSEDGLTVTIKLNPAATYHNNPCFGTEKTRRIKASDFVHSFKRLSAYGEDNLYWMGAGLIEGLDAYGRQARSDMTYGITAKDVPGLQAPDDDTLVLKLTRPYGPIATLLAHPAYSCVAEEAIRRYSDTLGQRPVGTGPYRLNASADGELYVFKRWDGYRGEKAGFERVTFYQREYWIQFESSFVDGTFHEIPSWQTLHDRVIRDGELVDAFKTAGAEVVDQPGHGYYFLSFNMGDPLWGLQDEDGRALRRAVSLSLDRVAMLEQARFNTEWNLPQTDVFPHGTEFEETGQGLNFGAHDLAEAKRVLDGSQFKGGLDPATGKPLVLKILTSEVGLYEAMTGALRTGVEALGMRLEARYLRATDYRKLARESDEHVFHAGWFLDYPDVINYLQVFRGDNVGVEAEFVNTARYKSEAFDNLFNQLEALAPIPANLEARRELAAAMAEQLAADQPIIPLFHQRTAKVRSSKVQWPQLPRQTFNDIRFVKEAK